MNYIWIIFFILFISLSGLHFYQSSKSINHIENEGKIAKIMGIKIGVKEFVENFNEYIDKLNKENMIINIYAGIGYLLAAFAALWSFIISKNSVPS